MEEFHSFYYDQISDEPVTSDFTVPAETEMSAETLRKMIDHHQNKHVPRYKYLKAAYDTKYAIFGRDRKEEPKPDNRLAADMAYDITQTFEGYFIGIPPTVKMDGEQGKTEYIKSYLKRNNQEDVDADLSEMCSIYGHAYEMHYQDDEGMPRTVALSPMAAFMVYDDSVLHRPMYFVRYAYGEERQIIGSFSDSENVYSFSDDDGLLEIGPGVSQYFGGVPATEFVQNTDKRGLYEGVLNLIEAYNDTLSEKANDVEYFSDAYLVIKGMKLTDEQLETFRNSKIINVYGNQPDGTYDVAFLAKPDADAMQENLINRLEMLIFKMAMVPDITDESFSTASGIALKMRLMPMSNLARKKEIKFVNAMLHRFKLLANYPNQPFTGNDWEKIEITMNRNMPEDIASEAQVAGALSGIVSEETQLSVLSNVVDDVEAELQRKESERQAKARSMSDNYPTNRTTERNQNEGNLQAQ